MNKTKQNTTEKPKYSFVVVTGMEIELNSCYSKVHSKMDGPYDGYKNVNGNIDYTKKIQYIVCSLDNLTYLGQCIEKPSGTGYTNTFKNGETTHDDENNSNHFVQVDCESKMPVVILPGMIREDHMITTKTDENGNIFTTESGRSGRITATKKYREGNTFTTTTTKYEEKKNKNSGVVELVPFYASITNTKGTTSYTLPLFYPERVKSPDDLIVPIIETNAAGVTNTIAADPGGPGWESIYLKTNTDSNANTTPTPTPTQTPTPTPTQTPTQPTNGGKRFSKKRRNRRSIKRTNKRHKSHIKLSRYLA